MSEKPDDLLEKCRRILKGALKTPRDEQIAQLQKRGVIDGQGNVLTNRKSEENGESRPETNPR